MLDNTSYKDPSLTIECYSYLHKVKARAGDSASAYKYLLEYSRYSDSSTHALMSTNLSKMEVTYRVRQKEDEIAKLEQTNYIKMLQHKQDRLLIYIVLGCLVFAVIVAFFIFKLYSSKARLNKDLTLANEEISRKIREKELLMVEIHHRVKNNLQFVSSLINMKSRESDIPAFTEAAAELNMRIQYMALIHKHLYQTSDISRIDLRENLTSLLNTISESYRSGEPVHLDCQMETIITNPDTAVRLGLIVTELVSNSYKYAFAGKQNGIISVSLFKKDGICSLLISDNGRGMSNEYSDAAAQGMGLKLVKLMAKQIKAEMNIDSDHNGTRCTVIFEPGIAAG